MAYTKMTLADFKQRLKDGDYKDATGARRGAGKADLTADEKDQCRKAIDKHFGVDSSAPAAKVQKKPKAVSKKVVAKAATNGKAEHKTNGVETKKAASKGTGKVGRKKRTTQAAVDSNDSALLTQLHLAKERIGTITQMVDTMKRAKEAYSALDTAAGMTIAAESLTQIVKGINDSLKGQLTLPEVDTTQADPAVIANLARTAAASHGLPGHESPVRLPYQTPVEETIDLS